MSQEMYDLLVEGARTLTAHQQAQLAHRLSQTVGQARAGNKNPFSWGCPKCAYHNPVKDHVVEHLKAGHKTRPEMAQWMPVPITEQDARDA